MYGNCKHMFFFIVRQMRFHLGNELPRIPACYPNNIMLDISQNKKRECFHSLSSLFRQNGSTVSTAALVFPVITAIIPAIGVIRGIGIISPVVAAIRLPVTRIVLLSSLRSRLMRIRILVTPIVIIFIIISVIGVIGSWISRVPVPVVLVLAEAGVDFRMCFIASDLQPILFLS